MLPKKEVSTTKGNFFDFLWLITQFSMQ